MKKWLQKGLVISVALLTFGLITPNHEIWDTLEQDRSKGAEIQGSTIFPTTEFVALEEFQYEDDSDVASLLLSAAKEQSYLKFGSRIAPKIGEEFDTYIFPKMQEAIETTVARLDDETVQSIAISERPSGAYSEKIFHISNEQSGQDLIRFHVRTENRPQDGYFYNFHYHTFEDHFAKHHNLGEIFWAKNTPPRWLS